MSGNWLAISLMSVDADCAGVCALALSEPPSPSKATLSTVYAGSSALISAASVSLSTCARPSRIFRSRAPEGISATFCPFTT
jgi:hypothetical protein